MWVADEVKYVGRLWVADDVKCGCGWMDVSNFSMKI